MIARPKMSRNEWKMTERGAFEVGHVAPFCCPGRCRSSARASRPRSTAATSTSSAAPARRRRRRRSSCGPGAGSRSPARRRSCPASSGPLCAHMRQFRRKLFGRASRTQREQSIRPKISRIDFDVTELENSQVWSGPPKPVVEFHTGRSRASASASATASPAWRRRARAATFAANGAAGRSAAAPGSGARRPGEIDRDTDENSSYRWRDDKGCFAGNSRRCHAPDDRGPFAGRRKVQKGRTYAPPAILR